MILDGISPVDVAVACTGAVHHARFASGRLHLSDHDVDAERAMAALGGDVPSCVQLLQLWHAAVATVGEGQMNSVHALRRVQEHPADEPPWEPPKTPFSGPPRPGALRSLANARLPDGLEDVLAQAAVLDCERRWDDDDFPVAGKRAGLKVLTQRVEAAVTESLRGAGEHSPVRVRVGCHVVAPDAVSADVDARYGHIRIDLDLPIGWLVRVWRAGLATAGGLVVLDVLDVLDVVDDGGDLSVLALEWRVHGLDLEPAVCRAGLRRAEGTDRTAGEWCRHGGGAPPSAGGQWWSVRTGPSTGR
jgi:hypothetical protein